MGNTFRYLITTAEEQTWKFDRPSIFLGEWCRRYDRRDVWQAMDAIVAAPYGLGRDNKCQDLARARSYEEDLFPSLCDALNACHSTQHGKRFWRIVIGHWLRRYVDVILNRFNTLQFCLQSNQLSGTVVYSDENYSLASMDSYEAIWAFNDDRWNNVLYSRILNLSGAMNFSVDSIAGGWGEGFQRSVPPQSESSRNTINFHGCLRNLARLAEWLSRDNDAFVINSYLPRKNEMLLQLALGQAPQSWISPKVTFPLKPDRSLRSSLAEKISSKSGDALFSLMCSLVFELLPVCYLEGFQKLEEQVDQLRWPNNPKFIFTSNNFDTDELFKLWTAKRVESGVKYFTGQHGNNYGTYRYMHPAIEEATADKFLTWGWTDGLPQHTPAFLFKTVGKKKATFNPLGDLLLIELHAGIRATTWDSKAEFAQYFEDQKIFASKLNRSIKSSLIIRLHHMWDQLGWCETARWKEYDASLRIDTGATDLAKLAANSRIIVHSYDSSGILETLSQNIPTLAFWQHGLDHVRESAMPYYQSLVDAGIVHLTAKSAAEKINEVWDDVESWWAERVVQEARDKFCSRYARTTQFPSKELTEIFRC